jgi:hypothetical protein
MESHSLQTMFVTFEVPAMQILCHGNAQQRGAASLVRGNCGECGHRESLSQSAALCELKVKEGLSFLDAGEMYLETKPKTVT